MKLSRDKLLGWLCIMRNHLGVTAFCIPGDVSDQLVEMGWCELGELGNDGTQIIHVTESGADASDLAAPEWGLDPVPVD